MDVEAIIREHLKGNGYDGLCNSDIECGCSFDCLFACGDIFEIRGCEPAYEGPSLDGESDFWMFPTVKERDRAIEEKIEDAWSEANV